MPIRSLTSLLHKVIQVVYLMLCLQRSVQKVQKRRLAVLRHTAGAVWALTDQSEERAKSDRVPSHGMVASFLT